MIFSYLLNMQSHPSWVCGLKHSDVSLLQRIDKSHPSWVCGLKLMIILTCLFVTGVTPFVGVWIETANLCSCCHCTGSHTLRGCVD